MEYSTARVRKQGTGATYDLLHHYVQNGIRGHRCLALEPDFLQALLEPYTYVHQIVGTDYARIRVCGAEDETKDGE